MTTMPECVGEHQTLVAAARLMKDLDVGSLAVCGDDQRLKVMLTDRDIVVKRVAQGGDPTRTMAGDLTEGEPVTIGVDDSLEETLATMREHRVRWLPVIDGHDLVGIVAQADAARALSFAATGATVEEISQ
ncbi:MULTISPECIES: CBS domain-containing protein [Microbacterium]